MMSNAKNLLEKGDVNVTYYPVYKEYKISTTECDINAIKTHIESLNLTSNDELELVDDGLIIPDGIFSLLIQEGYFKKQVNDYKNLLSTVLNNLDEDEIYPSEEESTAFAKIIALLGLSEHGIEYNDIRNVFDEQQSIVSIEPQTFLESNYKELLQRHYGKMLPRITLDDESFKHIAEYFIKDCLKDNNNLITHFDKMPITFSLNIYENQQKNFDIFKCILGIQDQEDASIDKRKKLDLPKRKAAEIKPFIIEFTKEDLLKKLPKNTDIVEVFNNNDKLSRLENLLNTIYKNSPKPDNNINIDQSTFLREYSPFIKFFNLTVEITPKKGNKYEINSKAFIDNNIDQLIKLIDPRFQYITNDSLVQNIKASYFRILLNDKKISLKTDHYNKDYPYEVICIDEKIAKSFAQTFGLTVNGNVVYIKEKNDFIDQFPQSTKHLRDIIARSFITPHILDKDYKARFFDKLLRNKNRTSGLTHLTGPNAIHLDLFNYKDADELSRLFSLNSDSDIVIEETMNHNDKKIYRLFLDQSAITSIIEQLPNNHELSTYLQEKLNEEIALNAPEKFAKLDGLDTEDMPEDGFEETLPSEVNLLSGKCSEKITASLKTHPDWHINDINSGQEINVSIQQNTKGERIQGFDIRDKKITIPSEVRGEENRQHSYAQAALLLKESHFKIITISPPADVTDDKQRDDILMQAIKGAINAGVPFIVTDKNATYDLHQYMIARLDESTRNEYEDLVAEKQKDPVTKKLFEKTHQHYYGKVDNNRHLKPNIHQVFNRKNLCFDSNDKAFIIVNDLFFKTSFEVPLNDEEKVSCNSMYQYLIASAYLKHAGRSLPPHAYIALLNTNNLKETLRKFSIPDSQISDYAKDKDAIQAGLNHLFKDPRNKTYALEALANNDHDHHYILQFNGATESKKAVKNQKILGMRKVKSDKLEGENRFGKLVHDFAKNYLAGIVQNSHSPCVTP